MHVENIEWISKPRVEWLYAPSISNGWTNLLVDSETYHGQSFGTLDLVCPVKVHLLIISVNWWSLQLQLCQPQSSCPVGAAEKWGCSMKRQPLFTWKWCSGSICSSELRNRNKLQVTCEQKVAGLCWGRHVTWCTKLVRTEHIRFLQLFFSYKLTILDSMYASSSSPAKPSLVSCTR